MDTAIELTGMEYGGINPIGLPPEWPILIDKAVAQLPGSSSAVGCADPSCW
jgi:prolyl-tRNA editing enzyme YbaK/EbsC (Cys-tRNA(Pro) deacylase)